MKSSASSASSFDCGFFDIDCIPWLSVYSIQPTINKRSESSRHIPVNIQLYVLRIRATNGDFSRINYFLFSFGILSIFLGFLFNTKTGVLEFSRQIYLLKVISPLPGISLNQPYSMIKVVGWWRERSGSVNDTFKLFEVS